MLVSGSMRITKSDLIKRIQNNKSSNISVFDVLDSKMIKNVVNELNNGIRKNGLSIIVLESG